ncbi:MAG: hypothetical protein IKZ72_05955 [Bacteroidales bacterium]|nr:hypothetical protein [Bacteroidales bacterium]
MEIRYKKVTALYAVLVLASVLMLKSFVIKPVSQLIVLHSLQEQVDRTGKDVEEHIHLAGGNTLTGKAGVQDLLLSALGGIAEIGCPVISGTPSRKKAPDSCPLYNLDIIFGGSFPRMLEALGTIDSLVASSAFETTVASCRIGAERSSDGRSWSLVCRESLQCLPAMASKRKGNAQSFTEVPAPEESPFYIPRDRTETSDESQDNSRAWNYPARGVPQGRLVGHIGSGRESLVIVEIGGESLQLHRGDGILLRDYGDSVKIAWNADTLILRQK